MKKYALLFSIILLAALMRLYHLPASGIFFGDAARDLKVAINAVENHQLPLLGIPSSVPRFSQGPLTIWYEMLIYLIFGSNLINFFYAFAFLSLIMIIALYELVVNYLDQKTALIAIFIIALSPLSIAHARMPYHITPLPLMIVIFLYALIRLSQKKPMSWFWAALTWAMVFQFELATLPLLLLLPWIFYRFYPRKLKSIKWLELVLGLSLGLLPQLIFDLTHRFQQLGGFGLWTIYRFLSLLNPFSPHHFGAGKLITSLSSYYLYGGRIFSVDFWPITLAIFILLILAFKQAYQFYLKDKLPVLIELSWGSILILSLGFFIHGSPSEAYFPPLIILLPLVLAYFFTHLPKKIIKIAIMILLVWGLNNIYQIYRANFFVDTQNKFSYGLSLGEQIRVMKFITSRKTPDFKLATLSEGGEFPTHFDNLRLVGQIYFQVQENQTSAHQFFIETKNSPLNTYPQIYKVNFKNCDLYYL